MVSYGFHQRDGAGASGNPFASEQANDEHMFVVVSLDLQLSECSSVGRAKRASCQD